MGAVLECASSSGVLRAASWIRRRSRAGAYCSARLALEGGCQRPARKLSIMLSILLRLAKGAEPAIESSRDSILTERHKRKWALAPLPANAQLRLPVSAFLALFLLTVHASLCRWLRAWPPGTSRPWQPRPSNGAYERPLKACAGCPSVGQH